MTIPPATIGRIFENRVIEVLIVISNGALVPYRPESDFEGTDLHVNLKHKPGEVRMQVKGRVHHEPNGTIKVEVDAEDIPEYDPKYLVAGEYFPTRAALGKWVWIVHTYEYMRLGRLSGGMWRGAFSPSNTAKDRWVDFRYNVNDLPWVVTSILERQALGENLPRKADEVRSLLRTSRARANAAPRRGRTRPRR